MKYNENKVTDGTFYITPKFSYQVFITRTYIKDLNGFYTTYEILFKEIKKKKKKKKKANKYNSNTIITPINFNLISKMVYLMKQEEIFLNINIIYYILLYKRALEFKKNKFVYNEVKYNNINIFIKK